MLNILVMTHGKMAEGISHAAEMILGEQPNFSYLCFKPNQPLDGLICELKERFKELGDGQPCLVMVDLFGGTPANAVVHLISEGYQLQAVTGVNLPMLIMALSERENYILEELMSEIKTAGIEGVVDIMEKLMEE